MVHLHHRPRGILGIGILGKMDGNGTVIGGLTDEKTDILHFEHGAGAVGEGFVEVVGAGEGVDGDGRGGGHFFLFLFFFWGVVVGRCLGVCVGLYVSVGRDVCECVCFKKWIGKGVV